MRRKKERLTATNKARGAPSTDLSPTKKSQNTPTGNVKESIFLDLIFSLGFPIRVLVPDCQTGAANAARS